MREPVPYACLRRGFRLVPLSIGAALGVALTLLFVSLCRHP
jgi:hypothetical protein